MAQLQCQARTNGSPILPRDDLPLLMNFEYGGMCSDSEARRVDFTLFVFQNIARQGVL